MIIECERNSIKILDDSKYVINNSFHCGIHHKKVSINSQLYSQLHKKILRKAIIEKRFQ